MSLSNYWAVGKCLKCENKDRWVKKTAVLDKDGKLNKIVRMCAPCRLIVKYENHLTMSAHKVFIVNVGHSDKVPFFIDSIEESLGDYLNEVADISGYVGCDACVKLWLHGEYTAEALMEHQYVCGVKEIIEFDDVLIRTVEKLTGGKWRIGEFKERTVKTVKEGITFFRPPRQLKPDKVKLPEIKVRGDTLSND